MVICIDYDGTITRDPSMWDRFISDAQSEGHRVVCATMRHDNDEERIVDRVLSLNRVQIIYTSRQAKAKYLVDKGIKVNIWIDDNPLWLYENA